MFASCVKEKLRCSACDNQIPPLILGFCSLGGTSGKFLQPSSGRGAVRQLWLCPAGLGTLGVLTPRDTSSEKKFSSMSSLKLSNCISWALSWVRREVWQWQLCKCPPGRCGGLGIPPLQCPSPVIPVHTSVPGIQELLWEGVWVKHFPPMHANIPALGDFWPQSALFLAAG